MNMKTVKQIVWAACLSVIGSASARAQVYYVSPDGEDADGRGTEAMPFATPGYALAKAMAAGDEVRVLKGVYLLDAAPEIKADNITLRGWNATREEVVFDAQGKGRCLQFDTAETGALVLRKNVTVAGITFRNGRQDVTPTGLSWTGAGAGVMLASEAAQWPAAGSQFVTNCVFANCVNVQSPGGGLCVAPGSTVVDCLFTNNLTCADVPRQNSSGIQGGGAGAFAPVVAGDVTFTGCVFVDNVATNGAAALGAGSTLSSYSKGQTGGLVVRGCTFLRNVGVSANTTDLRAAGCLPQRAWDVADCTFVSNRLEGAGGGGAVYTGAALGPGVLPSSARTNTFARCHFAFNEARGSATVSGALYQGMASPLALADCLFATNAGTRAAAVYSAGRLSVSNGTFTGSVSVTAKQAWSAIVFAAAADSRVEACDFVANASAGYYGALSVAANAAVVNCRFRGNARPGGGVFEHAFGFLQLHGAGATVRNCLFASNTNAVYGCAIGINATDVTVENCTFVGNRSQESAAKAASGVALSMSAAQAGTTVRNCLFADNRGRAADVPQIGDLVKGSVAYSWADTDVLTVGDENGNLAVGDGKPCWSVKFPGAYRPSGRTPGRDKGLAADWMAGATDFFGNKRILGSGVDFGYAEYRPQGFALILH